MMYNHYGKLTPDIWDSKRNGRTVFVDVPKKQKKGNLPLLKPIHLSTYKADVNV